MSIPFEPKVAGWTINVHLIVEYLAFFVAYRYYEYLKKQSQDHISSQNRISIILGAALGALIGSRVVAFLENPVLNLSATSLIDLFNLKTIMGGLFGGLLGVEIMKRKINERQSSGDLFTLPIVAGIFIGRIGCFLAGTKEFTYGKTTSLITGMDLGDGLRRHPLALYELVFLVMLYFFLRHLYYKRQLENGTVFKIFMLCYFSFRFFIEFIKPNVFFLFGLSTIQWLCLLCFVYYRNTVTKLLRANPKIYLL